MKFYKWMEHLKDPADMRDIKDKVDQRYSGYRSSQSLQDLIFRETSPRDPVEYYRRKMMACTRKPGQAVEEFEQQFMILKKTLEMALILVLSN